MIRLVAQDLKIIRSKCWEARIKWMNTGLELNLEISDLKALEYQHRYDADRCFTEMLNLWIKTNPKPMLKDLQEALRQPAVGLGQLAEDLGSADFLNQLGTTSNKQTLIMKKFIAPLHMFLIVVLLTGVYHTNTYTQVSAKDCYATGRRLDMAVVGEGANAVLYTIDSTGKAYHREVEIIRCEVMHKSTGKRLDCRTKKIRGNQFQISYQPTNRGRHQLNIKVEGQHIKGSPFNVTVIRKFDGDPIATIPRVGHPYSITTNQQGQMIIGERGNISIFDSSLKRIRSFGSPREFESPQDIAVDSHGNLLVTDQLNHNILKFNQNGSHIIAQVGEHGEGCLEFKHPRGIAIHPQNGLIYVSDTDNHHIQVIDHDLTKCNKIFGTWGSKKDQLYKPYGLAFDSMGNVYVADHLNHRIQVFTAEGEFLRQIGKEGKYEGELYYPSHIAIDNEDIIYVTQIHFDDRRISLFTSEGKFLISFTKKLKNIHDYFDLRGIAVDQNGTVYVVDWPDVQLF